ncbi:unnamed protein product [Mycena citricolor]|uniref:Beta-lactamase-related domain-containing protein n=1 Tax=Mycena citricolor TaxID=2018698 RepID=A0AAD2HDS4_9AGAR|nr:unnamed protein product [Mycena citricolor]
MHILVRHLRLSACLILATYTAARPALQVPLRPAGMEPDGAEVLTARMDRVIEGILRDFNTPGGAGVAVVHQTRDGEWVMESKGYGNATASGDRATGDTLFAIGSNSKLFDVVATGLLVSNESLTPRISWDTKIASMIPEWKLMDPVASSESTIVDIMSHRTGLPRHDLAFPLYTPVLDVIKRLRYLRPSAGFRETAQYNNLMYTTLSHLPVALTGTPFEEYVAANIFGPLGMADTTYFYNETLKQGRLLADGFLRDGANVSRDPFDQGSVKTFQFWDQYSYGISGAGGVISTPRDVATWLRALLEDGKNRDNESVIPPEVLQKVASGVTVLTPVARFPELSPIVYGGGQMRGTYRGVEMIEHGGSTPGFKSQIARFPSKNLGVAVLINEEDLGVSIMETIKYRIVDEYLALEPVDWLGRYRSAVEASIPPPKQPRSENATVPSEPFSSFAGKYRNPAYGDIDFCLILNGTTTGASCSEISERLLAKFPKTVQADVPTLIAEWDTMVTQFMLLEHYDAGVWNMTGLGVQSTGSEPWSFKMEGFVAEFDGPRGFSPTEVFWGAGAGVEPPKGDTVEERAEAWFEKVGV